MNLPFHLLTALGLALALAIVSRYRSPRAAFVVALTFSIAGAAAARTFARGSFEVLALGAWGIFLYGTLFAVGAAVLLARAPAKWARQAAVFAAACAFGLAGVALDAFVLEPHALELSRVSVASDKLTAPLRIAVLADLQADRIGGYERRAIRRVLAEHPDLIVMPGDYVQGAGRVRHNELEGELRVLLGEEGWTAPRGVFAVRGNCEDDDWARMFVGLPVTTFDVTSTVLRGDVAITGLTLGDSFSPDLEFAPRSQFHIVVGHGPDFALGKVAADLLFAGHTHGGQVRLPFIGPLITLSSVPRAWAAGVTPLAGGRTLIVSRGAGMERGLAPRLRFLCRPEIVIVDVTPRARPVSGSAAPASAGSPTRSGAWRPPGGRRRSPG
jgi:predicted MPP superfamily phosphohydrolase